MAFCPTDCADEELTPNYPGGCEPKPRKTGIDRIGFFPCDVDLPNPLTCAGLQALVDANTLTFSSPLANIEIADPTIEELEIASCLPPMQMVTSRVINFQDRIKIETLGNEVSPAVNPNLFYDYDFWKDKKAKSARMRYLFTMCDGSVRLAKDENGTLMEAALNVFLAYERQGTGGTAYTLEIKKGSLVFKGDPLDFIKPEFDNAGDVFIATDCAGLIQ